MKSSELFRNPLSSCCPYPFAIETRERSETPPGDPGRPLRGPLSILGWQPQIIIIYRKLLSYMCKLLTYKIYAMLMCTCGKL